MTTLSLTTLSLATDLPRSAPLFQLLEDWAESIADASGGELTIRIFAPGELVGAFEAFDAVPAGIIDLAWTSPAYHLFSFPNFRGFNTPFEARLGADAAEAAWRTIQAEDLSPDDVDILATSFDGDSHFLLSTPLESAEDFDGLRLRAPGENAAVLERLDAVSVALSFGEVSTALQTGAIDGAAMSGQNLSFLGAEPAASALLKPANDALLAPLLRTLIVNEQSLAALSGAERDILLSNTGLDLSREWGSETKAISEGLVDAFNLQRKHAES